MKNWILLHFALFLVSASAQQTDTCTVYTPKVITPDCDHYPCEGFQVISNCTLKEFQLVIYNRWGEVVFESQDQSEIWYPWRDEEHDIPDGVYVWLLKWIEETDANGDGEFEFETREHKGHLTFLK